MGQNVSLLTSVTCPTVTVGPVVSKLDLTLTLFFKLKLFKPTFLELKMENEVVEEEDEPSNSFDEEPLSKTVVPIHLGEVQRFRAIGVGICGESVKN
ncbi:thioredoxin F-type, chloroplastic [Trifolium repens]|nr:thioredoxin F-type, chloroplastic [Trifolium repens]